MRHVSRRFPNGVTVYVEKHPRGIKVYTAMKNKVRLGSYRVLNFCRSRGEFDGERFRDFYGWLRAARGA